MFVLPRLYPILDSAFFADSDVDELAREAISAGAEILQLRAKEMAPRKLLNIAQRIRQIAGGNVCKLILNDRPDLCVLAEFDGVHLGQRDLSLEGARRAFAAGAENLQAPVAAEKIIGLSTHTLEQVTEAEKSSADYLAIGPVFATSTKRNPDAVVGLEGVRAARAATRKPLVAIGGISLLNCRSVLDAGADSVAVISSIWRDPAGAPPRKVIRDFLRILL